jgi:hypothetical protein
LVSQFLNFLKMPEAEAVVMESVQDQEPQLIHSRHITNPTKLVTLLRALFGEGHYHVEVSASWLPRLN